MRCANGVGPFFKISQLCGFLGKSRLSEVTIKGYRCRTGGGASDFGLGICTKKHRLSYSHESNSHV